MTGWLRRLRFRRDHRWTPDHLSDYLDGDLVARSRARLEHHLRECPECLSALRSLERVLGLLHAVPAVSDEERPDIASAVRRRLRDPASH
jgi:anti-sigma factor RsiW